MKVMKLKVSAHRGEEHGEGVDEGLGVVSASDGEQDGRSEQDVTDG